MEGLARIGVSCLQLLVLEAGDRFDETIWTSVCDTLSRVFSESTPHELLSCRQYLITACGIDTSTGSVGENDLPGGARRLCKTPYGDGIVMSVRPCYGCSDSEYLFRVWCTGNGY